MDRGIVGDWKELDGLSTWTQHVVTVETSDAYT